MGPVGPVRAPSCSWSDRYSGHQSSCSSLALKRPPPPSRVMMGWHTQPWVWAATSAACLIRARSFTLGSRSCAGRIRGSAVATAAHRPHGAGPRRRPLGRGRRRPPGARPRTPESSSVGRDARRSPRATSAARAGALEACSGSSAEPRAQLPGRHRDDGPLIEHLAPELEAAERVLHRLACLAQPLLPAPLPRGEQPVAVEVASALTAVSTSRSSGRCGRRREPPSLRQTPARRSARSASILRQFDRR
jgi:hypothetical protein